MRDNQKLYEQLRSHYPYFRYASFSVNEEKYQYTLRYHFTLADVYHFYPVLMIPKTSGLRPINRKAWNNLAFHIGMVEAISYWKAACPPRFIVEPYHLNQEQVSWWKKLAFHGLEEFFYENGIQAPPAGFMEITSGTQPLPPVVSYTDNQRVMVPVGGGKDSAVTLDLLQKGGYEVIPIAVNPRPAILETIENAGIPLSGLIRVNRQIDDNLLKLNEEGFLNGHTPFSALIAFISTLAAELAGAKHIALSNESSANEATIPGTTINHQYSKSFEFEKDFREYSKTYVSSSNYFSFLRPLNELQIGKIFAALPHHYYSFKSCNRGSKDNVWCGECPKCLFTAVILAPYISRQQQHKIFGKDMLDDEQLSNTFDQLSGQTAEKPFECVGTVNEVKAAIAIARRTWDTPLPSLLQRAVIPGPSQDQLTELQSSLNTAHFVPEHMVDILAETLKKI